MARPTLVHSVLAAVGLMIAAAQGCSKQGEGERCEPLGANDEDCDDGLICVTGAELGEEHPDNDFGRCCPEDLSSSSDSRCRPGGTVGTFDGGTDASSGGTGGTAGQSTMAGAGGEPAIGGSPGSAGAAGAAGAPSSGGGQAGAMSVGGAGGQSSAGVGGV